MKLKLSVLVGLIFVTCSLNVAFGQSTEVTILRILDIQTNAREFWEITVPMFETENPDIQIQQESVSPDVYSQLRTARLASGDVDIVAGQPQNDLFTEASRRQYLPLTGQAFLDNFYEGLIAQATFDGDTYIVPTSFDGVVVYYNRSIFEEYGLAVPETWTEFLSVCETLQSNGITPILFGGLQQWPVAYHTIALETNIVRSRVPNFYDTVASGETRMDDPVWVEVFDKLAILSRFYQPFALGQDLEQVPNLFALEEGAMMISGFPDAGAITRAEPSFSVGIFSLPGSENSEDNLHISTKIGVGYMVVANSPNVDAAMRWLEFYSRPDIYQIYADVTGEFPSQPTAVVSDPVMQEIIRTIDAEGYQQLLIWENLTIPGARYDSDALGIAVVSGAMSGQEAADQMQQNVLDSRDNWELPNR